MSGIDLFKEIYPVDVRELKIGQHEAMQMAASVWGLLWEMDPKYLKSFISRMEKDPQESTQMVLPVFKMVLFFTEHLQEHCRADTALSKAMADAREQAEKEDFMQEVVLPV